MMKYLQLRLLLPVLFLLGSIACMSTDVRVIAAPPSTRPAVGLRDKTPDCHALVGGRIVLAPGRVIESGTIVIRNGVISAVGANIAPPADARIWNLSGKTIYPGLIDAYSEASAMPLGTNASDTKTSDNLGGAGYWNPNVQPERRVATDYNADEKFDKQFRSQGITVRLVAPEGGVIKGVSALVTTGDDHTDRTILDTEVALHIRLTVKRSHSRGQYPNSPMGAVALARQAMVDADWYARAWQAYRGNRNLPRPELNVALEALQPYSTGSGLVIVDASDEQFHLRADRFAREFGLHLAVRGSGREYRRLDAIRASNRTIIVPVNFPKAPNVATAESAARVSVRDMMHWDIAPENPARLVNSGATIALTSYGLKKVDEFLAGVRRAVHRGLSSDAALRALTTTPATLLGIEDRLGTIAAGKAAHLVVTDGDLFEEETKIHDTWVDGRRYEVIDQPLVDLRGKWLLGLKGGTGKRPKGLKQLEVSIHGEPNKLAGTVRLPRDEQEQAVDNISDKDVETEADVDDSKVDNNDVDSEESDNDDDAESTRLQDVQLNDMRLAFRFDDSKKNSKKEIAPNENGRQNDSEDSGDKQRSNDGGLGIGGVVRVSATVTIGTDGQLNWSGQIHWSAGGYSELQAKKIAEADDDPTGDADTNAEQLESADTDDKLEDDELEDDESENEIPGHEAPEEEQAEDERVEDEQAEDDAEQEEDLPASFAVNYPLGAYGRQAIPEQPEVVAFTGATVWTCDEPGVLNDAKVLFGAGKIIAVGTDIEVPRGAKVIDVTGRHITPGLIDCHSHMATDGGINESTQAVTAEVRIGDFIDANDITIYRQLAGGLTTSNILHGSANPIGGQNQVIKLRWGALAEAMKFDKAPAGIKFALGENVKQSNWGPEYTTRYPQTRMGVEQIMRDEFVAAREYLASHQAWAADHAGLPPRRDLELEAVGQILTGDRWIHCHSYRQDEILTLLRTLEQFGIQIGTLQHILEGYKVADAMAKHGAMGSSFSDWWAYKFEVYDAIPYNGALMYHAGVNVSFNSDDRELARHLNQEAVKAVKYGGVPPAEALKFVTLNPAMQLRIDEYVGSITPGKHADLVVWSGPPLSNFSHAEQSWIDGRKYFDRADAAKQRATTRDMRATLVQKILKSGQAMIKPGEKELEDQQLWPSEDIFCHGHEWPHE